MLNSSCLGPWTILKMSTSYGSTMYSLLSHHGISHFVCKAVWTWRPLLLLWWQHLVRGKESFKAKKGKKRICELTDSCQLQQRQETSQDRVEQSYCVTRGMDRYVCIFCYVWTWCLLAYSILFAVCTDVLVMEQWNTKLHIPVHTVVKGFVSAFYKCNVIARDHPTKHFWACKPIL